MQYRDRTIEFIAPVALAAMIDKYAIFGPKLGDRLPSFLGVSLSEHLVGRLRLMRFSMMSGTALSHTFVERFPQPARTSGRCGVRK
jgi:hypothetical protein